MKECSVSVCVPVYNVEQYIARCLESILSQSLKNIEIIVVNDCTPDKSMDIVRMYAKNDSRIKIIEHDTNHGLMMARRTGYMAAKGEYVTFVDSDDYLPNDALETLYCAIESQKVDMVKGRLSVVNEKGVITDYKKSISPVDNSGIQLQNDILKDKIMHNIWGAIYCRKLFECHSYKTFENQTNSEDLLLMLQLCDNIQRYAVIEKCVYNYYVNSSSSSRQRFTESNLRQYLNALSYIYNNPKLNTELRKEYVSKYIGSLLYNNYDVAIIKEFFKDSLEQLFTIHEIIRLHGLIKGFIWYSLYRSSSLRNVIYKIRPVLNKIRKCSYL